MLHLDLIVQHLIQVHEIIVEELQSLSGNVSKIAISACKEILKKDKN